MADENGFHLDNRERFVDFRKNIAQARMELSQILKESERMPNGKITNRDTLISLERALNQFLSLQHSEFGWQDMHAMDKTLVLRAQALLDGCINVQRKTKGS